MLKFVLLMEIVDYIKANSVMCVKIIVTQLLKKFWHMKFIEDYHFISIFYLLVEFVKQRLIIFEILLLK